MSALAIGSCSCIMCGLKLLFPFCDCGGDWLVGPRDVRLRLCCDGWSDRVGGLQSSQQRSDVVVHAWKPGRQNPFSYVCIPPSLQYNVLFSFLIDMFGLHQSHNHAFFISIVALKAINTIRPALPQTMCLRPQPSVKGLPDSLQTLWILLKTHFAKVI